jgi:hypothetical protein
MSIPVAGELAVQVRGREWLRVRTLVAVARVLTYLRPTHLRAVVAFVARGAPPATTQEAAAARAAVCGVSARCAGLGCLQRSVAVVLLCRSRGSAPAWCSGFRTEPFVAHAWVEADGAPVDEPADVAGYRVVLAVGRPPAGAGAR